MPISEIGSKRAVHVFSTSAEEGVYSIPEGAMVLIEATHEIYFKVNNVGLSGNSTLQEAINMNKLVSPENTWHPKNDGVNSDLDAALWGGHRLIALTTTEPQPNDGVVGDIWFLRDA